MNGGWVIEPISSNQIVAVVIVGMALLAAALISITGIIFGAWHSIVKTRAEASLKHEMIARGNSVDEIVRVIAAHSGGEGWLAPGRVAEPPCACEAVVCDADGDWCPALVLRFGGGRYWVHYVTREMSENEWVGEDRIRFPTGSRLPEQMAHLEAEPGINGTLGKPPVEAEV
jgi:hypothetical protein